MKPKQIISQLLAAGLVAALASPAFAATTITWNLTSQSSSTGLAERTYLSSDGLHTIKLRAFTALNPNGTGALSQLIPGDVTPINTWTDGVTAYGTSGVGIKGLDNTTTSTGFELDSPDHAIDNYGRDELLLLEFDAAYDPASLMIGWGAVSTTGTSGSPDLEVWVGNESMGANMSVAGYCMTGCLDTNANLEQNGFTHLSLQDVAPGTSRSFTNTANSRYMLVSGGLAQADDFFKFKQVVVNVPQVPEPGSLLLGVLGLGLLAGMRQGALRGR